MLQLVAGVGDEVGAHLHELVLLGEIAERHEQLRRGRRLRLAEPRHRRRHAPLHRHALDQLHVDTLLRRERVIDRADEIGIARDLAHRQAVADLGKELGDKPVVVHDRAGGIERERRRGDGIDDRAPALAVEIGITGGPLRARRARKRLDQHRRIERPQRPDEKQHGSANHRRGWIEPAGSGEHGEHAGCGCNRHPARHQAAPRALPDRGAPGLELGLARHPAPTAQFRTYGHARALCCEAVTKGDTRAR